MNVFVVLRIFKHFDLDRLIPLVILLKIITVVTTITMVKFVLLCGAILASGVSLMYTYKTNPWVIVCMVHGLLFISIDLIRFITFKDRMDYFFIRYEFFDFILALISITSILNRTNNKLLYGVNMFCHYIVIIIAIKNKDYWMVLYTFTDLITTLVVMMLKEIDKRTLFDRIVKELKQEIICSSYKKLSDILTPDKILSAVKSITIDSLISGTNDLIGYMTKESDKSTVEYLRETSSILSFVKIWISGILPPENVQYFLTCIGKSPLTCSACITLTLIDPYITIKTSLLLVLLICWELYNLFNNFELSTDYLMKYNEKVSGILDTVIESVSVVSDGLDTLNVTIVTLNNGIKKTIEVTTNISDSVYSSFLTGTKTVADYTKAHPYKVALIGLIPVIGIAGYIGYNRNKDQKRE